MRPLRPGEVGINRSRLEELTAKKRAHDAYLRGMQVLAANAERFSISLRRSSIRRRTQRRLLMTLARSRV